MRFQGRVRFQDLDTADLDVAIEVDDTHVRLLSGDESLGRWCLADVRAHRVVANEFDLELEGETVRFLAADQVNFAYGAVQNMAEAWARYHSMNVVRRARAVAAARKRNEPSRLNEVSRAFAMAAPDLLSDQTDLMTADGPVVDRSQPDASPTDTNGDDRGGEYPANSSFWRRVEQAQPDDFDSEDLPAAPESADEAPKEADLGEAESTGPQATPDEEAPPGAVDEPADDPSGSATSPITRSDSPRTEGIYFKPRVEGESLSPPVGRPDLGTYADGRHPAETSGWRASVRSIFGRSSREPHEHVYVESTTAVGLTRRVCIECGNVSIGVSPD